MTHLLLISLLTMGIPNVHAHPAAYYATSITGQVVDYETKKPLEGVIVVAQWELFEEGVGHAPGHTGDMLKVVEVKTDRDGKYNIPAWGPLRRPRNAYLYNHDPELVYFKPGYYLETRRSILRAPPNTESVRTSIWDRETIELLRFSGDPREYTFWDGQVTAKYSVNGTREEYASRLGFFGSSIDRNWTFYPSMAKALYLEVQRLKAIGLKDGYDPHIPRVGKAGTEDRSTTTGIEK